MPNYPKELAHVFEKEAGRRTPRDIADVIRHYQDSALELAEKMTRTHEAERKSKAHQLALEAIEDTAKNHGPEHRSRFRQRWLMTARYRIQEFLERPKVPREVHAAIERIYDTVNELVREKLEKSSISHDNRLALTLLYGKRPLTVMDVARATEKKHQIILQVEANIHRHIRNHSTFPELQRQWNQDVLPFLTNDDELGNHAQSNNKYNHLKRLFKR